MFKKVASLVLAFALVFSLSVSAFAAAPRAEKTNSAKSVFAFSGTTALCNVSVHGKTGTTRIDVHVYLQRADANGSYKGYISWYDVVYTDSYTLDQTVTNCPAGDYRLLVEATVYGASSTGESVTAVSYDTCN